MLSPRALRSRLLSGWMLYPAHQLKREDIGNWVPFTAKFVPDRHSFSLVEVSPERFTPRQISLDGDEVDRFSITKPVR